MGYRLNWRLIELNAQLTGYMFQTIYMIYTGALTTNEFFHAPPTWHWQNYLGTTESINKKNWAVIRGLVYGYLVMEIRFYLRLYNLRGYLMKTEISVDWHEKFVILWLILCHKYKFNFCYHCSFVSCITLLYLLSNLGELKAIVPNVYSTAVLLFLVSSWIGDREWY